MGILPMRNNPARHGQDAHATAWFPRGHRHSKAVVPALLIGLALTIGGTRSVTAADLYVSPAGNDRNAGTQAAPVQSLEAARNAARKFAGKEPVTVHVADGVYYLPETLVFTAEDSGSAKAPVVYQADNEGAAILSGGKKLDLKWQPFRDGILQASTSPGLAIDQLFIDGKRQRMARYPNYDASKPTAAYQGFSADAFSKERAAKWADPAGGYIHAMHSARWGGYHYRITGKNPDGTVAYEGGWQNNRQMGMHKDFRMVENIFEELDAPGEWFHNAKTNTLYYLPEPGIDLAKARVEVVRLKHLVEFQGTSKAPVRFITLQGFVFRHAARTFMENKEPLLRSDWTIYRGGAVLLNGTEDVRILDSEFDQPGGNAIFVSNYNRRAIIRGCHIHDAGASGICFVGDPAAVRDPLFEYNQTQDLTKIDRTPGPKTDNYPADSAVEDCLITGIGRVERQPAGVQISMASGIAVRDCSIYDCARSGINIGDGCWGGHLVERCDVFDTVLETHDHGSFNSWGRDRYWVANHRKVSEPEVKKDPGIPFLDAMKPTILRDSRWRCDHGWDIDLDDGSSNYWIYNNLLLRGGLKFREGYGRKAWNNILVNSGFHPHVWFDDSDSSFDCNIAMAAHASVGQPAGWGKDIDWNFFTSQADRARNLKSGGDSHSLFGDPMFIDPAAGDFRVQEKSPVLLTGFKNFPMDQFGVKKPALKAIAKTPDIPQVKAGPAQQAAPVAEAKTPAAPPCWLGATLHGLEGEEFSAFGVSKDDGGVQLVEVPAGSAAAKAGFQTNDLIQSVNGRKATDILPFFTALREAKDGPLDIRFVRNQAVQASILKDAPYVVVESAPSPEKFVSITLPAANSVAISAQPSTKNNPLAVLVDGKLEANYGAVFDNHVVNGAYKIDLGASVDVMTVSSWSYSEGQLRGRQIATVYGSDSPTDPGWDTTDKSRFVPIGSIDTAVARSDNFVAASLRGREGFPLGKFRWIIWKVSPVSPLEENTAFQELAVGTDLPPAPADAGTAATK